MNISHLMYEAKFRLFESIMCNGVVWSAEAARVAKVSQAYAVKSIREFEQTGLIVRKGSWGRKKVELKATGIGKIIWSRLIAIKKVIEVN